MLLAYAHGLSMCGVIHLPVLMRMQNAGKPAAGDVDDVSLSPIISQPRSGITVPEGSTVPAALLREAHSPQGRERAGTSVNDSGLRVNLPRDRASSIPATPSNVGSQNTPVRPSFVETPSEPLSALSEGVLA